MSHTASRASSFGDDSEGSLGTGQVDAHRSPSTFSELAKELSRLIHEVSQVGLDLEEFALTLQEAALSNTHLRVPDFLGYEMPEDRLFTPVTPAPLGSLTIGGVDGGLVVGSLAGVDIVGVRAVGVVLQFGSRQINDVRYYPQKRPSLQLIPSFRRLSHSVLDQMASYHRAIQELQVACKTLQDMSTRVDYLLMDGSFSFKRVSIPNTYVDTLQGQYYAWLRRLNKTARSVGTDLAWVVKDTRSSLFADFIGNLLPHVIGQLPQLYRVDYRRVISAARDSPLMHYFLPPKSRSFVVRRTFGSEPPYEVTDGSYSFFLSVVPRDIPLRVDFSLPEGASGTTVQEKAQELAEVLLPLSEYDRTFSLPSPIVEADARARIPQDEFEILLAALRRRTMAQVESLPLRRGRSPFHF